MKREIYKNGNLAIHGRFVRCDLCVEDGIISDVAPSIEADDARTIDLTGKRVYPKLIEEHSHGAFGMDFSIDGGAAFDALIAFYRRQHVGTIFPTLMTDSTRKMCAQLDEVVKSARRNPEIKGIHVEGPFLSCEYKGATPRQFIQQPNLDTAEQLLEHGGGLLKLVTIAPELPGALELVKFFAGQGVKVNLGHTGATYEQTMACLDAGADGFTHTFNGMRLMHQHELGAGGCAMLSDAYCEAICDGRHLNGHTVELLLKVKGLDRLILVTDSMMAAGMPDGEYRLGSLDIVVTGGDARTKGEDSRAGSTLLAYDGVKKFAAFTGLPMEQAIVAMSENPAKRFGLDTGSLEPGRLAEFFWE